MRVLTKSVSRKFLKIMGSANTKNTRAFAKLDNNVVENATSPYHIKKDNGVGVGSGDAVAGIHKKLLEMPFNKFFTWESIEQLLKKRPQNVQTFEQDLLTACPIMHARTLPLLQDFIRLKQSHGNQLEKTVFARATTATLIQRFLHCRPVAFLTGGDSFVLRNSHGSETIVDMAVNIL